MSLYPSLEDMGVDRLMEQQRQINQQIYQQQTTGIPAFTANPYPEMNNRNASSSGGATIQDITDTNAYPDLHDFMGMELSKEIIAANMPEYLNNRNQVANIQQVPIFFIL